MGSTTSAPYDRKEYDIIIAGGGTAACVIAGRLSVVDPSLSILMIEGGGNNLNNPTITNPAFAGAHLAPNSKTTLVYKSNASEHLAGREALVHTGAILGGGSSINILTYTRAQAQDYDDWETEGWDYQSLLPYLKKMETYRNDNSAVDENVHGYKGPLHISPRTYGGPRHEDDIITAAKALGIPEVSDLQDFRTVDGISRALRYVSTDGKRQDAAHCYVHPLMADGKHPNLHMLLESNVTRVLFDKNQRANGVEYVPSGSSQASIIKAKKMVILASGALGSPSILERSGVGSKELLQKLDVPVISNLPDVGEHFQDHPVVGTHYKTNLKPEETLDRIRDGRLDVAKAMREKDPILGWNGVDIGGKLRPTDEEINELGPEFKELWDRDFKAQTMRPLIVVMVSSGYIGDPSGLPSTPEQYCGIGTFTPYPYSRGSIHIVSSSVSTPATFDSGMMSHPIDIKAQIWAYKKQREIYRRTNTYQGELEMCHPKFPPGSSASLLPSHKIPNELTFPTLDSRKSLKPIQYTPDDDRAIEQFVRERVTTCWHPMGTCRMAPHEKGGVVDAALNVYGTGGLKVADMSICPGNVGANTLNTAVAIGEKAAAIIAADLGINFK